MIGKQFKLLPIHFYFLQLTLNVLERCRQVLLVLEECLDLRLERLIDLLLLVVEAVHLLLEVKDLVVQLLDLLLGQLFICLHLGLQGEHLITQVVDFIFTDLLLLLHQRFLVTQLSFVRCRRFLQLIRPFFELSKVQLEALLGSAGIGLALLYLLQVLLLEITNLFLLDLQLLFLLLKALFQLVDLHLRLLVLRFQLLQLAHHLRACFKRVLLQSCRLCHCLIQLLLQTLAFSCQLLLLLLQIGHARFHIGVLALKSLDRIRQVLHLLRTRLVLFAQLFDCLVQIRFNLRCRCFCIDLHVLELASKTAF